MKNIKRSEHASKNSLPVSLSAASKRSHAIRRRLVQVDGLPRDAT